MIFNSKNILVFTFLAASASNVIAEQKDNSDKLTGPYLGQKLPGLTPEPFAKNIVTTPNWEYGVVFAPSMDEMYFLRKVTKNAEPQREFVLYEQKDDVWQERVISKRIGTPTLSPDNKTMFFGRGYKERTKDGWSEMKRLGESFEPYRIMRVTSSFDGTLAFDEVGENGNGILRYSTLKNGEHSVPKPFPKHINTGTWNAHPFIAPDESYLIWDGRRGKDARNSDLFISFKQLDGRWGEAISFGNEVNSSNSEFAAQVTPDGKYLFFNRTIDGNVDTYWVDAQVIEKLKPKHLKQQFAKLAPKATPAQAVGSFRDVPLLEKAFVDTAPKSSDSSLKANRLSVAKHKASEIVNLAKEIGEGKHGRYDSLLISHNDELVFESYYKRGRYALAHPQASATKGYTSLLLGRAIQLGYLSMADLEKPLVNFLKGIDRNKLTAGAEKITLHKALTMRGGLNVDAEKWQELQKTPEQLKGQKLVQVLLEHSAAITDEAQSYKYGNYNPMLVMAVIDAVAPKGAEEFIKSEILDKLNIANYNWGTHVSELPQAGWMVSFTSRDMLKFGNIVANDGKWQGKQFISAEYLAKATRGLVKPTEDWMPADYRYGYFWYHTPIETAGKTYDVAFAWGGGGQRVIVIKELDLVIAITGHDGDDKIMAQISNVIIPAFTS